jgi:hypothetical protein
MILINGGITIIATTNAVTKARMPNLKAEKERSIWSNGCMWFFKENPK